MCNNIDFTTCNRDIFERAVKEKLRLLNGFCVIYDPRSKEEAKSKLLKAKTEVELENIALGLIDKKLAMTNI